jgi:oligoribonuclease NrnB/cAMP/cGMP phosphodiesterase (DHH superfamily)
MITTFPNHRHVVIYHAACSDGFLACVLFNEEFLINKNINDSVLIPAHYGTPLPDGLKEDDIVYLVDYSYKKPQLIELCRRVKHVWVLDHHKTAKAELFNLNISNLTIFFDMEKSGARLAHDFIKYDPHISETKLFSFGDNETPSLVKYVEDRDLWKFVYPETKPISAYLKSISFDYYVWLEVLNDLEIKSLKKNIIDQGDAILRFIDIGAESLAKKAIFIDFPIVPDATIGVPVASVNATAFISEVGEEMCTMYQDEILFSISWFYRTDGKYQYSLRSRTGYDVSIVARNYGGGGHASAAGFESDTLITGVG